MGWMTGYVIQDLNRPLNRRRSPPVSKEPGMHTPSHAAHSGHYFTKHLTHTGRKIHTLCHSKIGASSTGNRTLSLITGTLFGRWNSSSWFFWDHSGKATSTYICHHCLHLLLGFLPWTTRITPGGFQSTFGTWWPYVHESPTQQSSSHRASLWCRRQARHFLQYQSIMLTSK